MFKLFKRKTVIIREKEVELESDRLKKLAETDKIKIESDKIKAEVVKTLHESSESEQKLVLNRLEAKAKAKSEKTTGVLCKMMILSQVMTSTYSQDSNLGNNRLFDDNDLIDYKKKMKELLNQL